MKTSFTDMCFRHLSNLYRLQESHWNKYMDYRSGLIPVRVLSCVVRQFDYEYDHVRRHLRLCPLMADETDAGMEAPAPESVRRIGGVFGSSLSCPTFFFGGVGSLSFRVEGALVVNHASPGWSVLSLPCFELVMS